MNFDYNLRMQLKELFSKFDTLHEIHGSQGLSPIYGAGEVDEPRVCLIFMNPTAKNISSKKEWSGIRAPWLGTKNVWKLLYNLGLFTNQEMLSKINVMKPESWTVQFAEDLYNQISQDSLYITNIAKCTQDDARHLSDSVYKEYLPLMLEELEYLKPKIILTLGNQVSSVLLSKNISVSQYLKDEYENLTLSNGANLRVYPSYYPVGQGMRNMSKAVERIRNVISIIH